jgi:signal transduction histidine kinase
MPHYAASGTREPSMDLRLQPGLRYLAVLPAAIMALSIADYLGIEIPNQPGVLLLAVVYCAYRGGLGIGLVGTALHILYTAIFFSNPDQLFVYSHANMVRAVVIGMVAPAMATMIGLLRHEADQLLAREKLSEAMLTKLNAELEGRVAARTTEAVLARDVAERANEVKSMFLANVSHELRTPLNAIIGFSELMVSEMMGPLGNDKYRSYARDIHDSGSHLLAVINDILDLSKAEAGKLELDESWFQVDEVVVAACRLLSQRAAAAKLTLVVSLAPDSPMLHADERKLKQVIINLLANAIKFTKPGGRVELTVTVTSAGLNFAVTDTGIGIPAAYLDRVLLPFVQVDNSFSRPHQGTGLGLPLVKAITELHGGRLQLESQEGVGTTVSVLLPLERLAPGCSVASPPGRSAIA